MTIGELKHNIRFVPDDVEAVLVVMKKDKMYYYKLIEATSNIIKTKPYGSAVVIAGAQEHPGTKMKGNEDGTLKY